MLQYEYKIINVFFGISFSGVGDMFEILIECVADKRSNEQHSISLFSVVFIDL